MNTAAPAQQRGGVLSALYLLAYLSMGVVAIILGIVATGWGLRLAIGLGAGHRGPGPHRTHARKRDAGVCLPPFPSGARLRLRQPVRSIMPEALKLYHAAASPNSRRVRIFLVEKGISLPLVSGGGRAAWRRLSRHYC